MLNRVEENIKNFLNSIKSIKENTDKIKPDILRYPTYFILLDILAQFSFPNEEGVGKRFKNLIDSYSNWEFRNYVSILLLKFLLKIEKEKKCFKENKKFKDLEEKVNKVRNKWGQRVLSPKEADLTIEEFELFKKNRYWKLIKMSRYPSVIYELRNHMIHNLRFPKPKDPLDTTDIQEPYYYILNDSYELCIPAEFISILVEKCSNNLKEKVLQEISKYDPYKIFKIMPN